MVRVRWCVPLDLGVAVRSGCRRAVHSAETSDRFCAEIEEGLAHRSTPRNAAFLPSRDAKAPPAPLPVQYRLGDDSQKRHALAFHTGIESLFTFMLQRRSVVSTYSAERLGITVVLAQCE